MYGTTQKEVPNPKGQSDHRQRLQAVFDLKTQIDEIKDTKRKGRT